MHMTGRADARSERRDQIDQLAQRQAGVLSRRQLYAMGVTRWVIKAELRGRRWNRVGRHCICVHRGPLNPRARFWMAVLSGGPRAMLDGVASLQWAGLRHFESDLIRVSVPRGARVFRQGGVDVRQTRRWSREDLAVDSIARSRNEVAAIRAALWARTPREGALIITMVVQQRLATAEQLGAAMLRIRRDRRRAYLQAVIVDLIGGVRSIGELDFARECRRRGLPEPDRQVLRKTRNGAYFLDVRWQRWGVVVEIDGIHHSWADQIVPDALRHNDIALTRDVVLRLPLLALRLEPDAFFEQIERALLNAGWSHQRRTA